MFPMSFTAGVPKMYAGESLLTCNTDNQFGRPAWPATAAENSTSVSPENNNINTGQ